MANDENVRNAYTGIIDLLPVDWQRFVNDQLPYLEGLIDQEVEEFGRALAEHLVWKVCETTNRGKDKVKSADAALASALKGLETSQQQADHGLAAIEDVRAELSALDVASATEMLSRGWWHASTLRGLLDQLREDIAADRMERLNAYVAALKQWRRSASDLVTAEELQPLLEAASKDHEELIESAGAADQGTEFFGFGRGTRESRGRPAADCGCPRCTVR